MVQLSATTGTKSSTQDGVITMMSEPVEEGYEPRSKTAGSGKWDVIIPNPKLKKTPRLCLFVTSLIFLMVAAIVLVLVIKLSLPSREECCKTSADSKDVQKISFTEKEGSLEVHVSWEMKRAFLELRQIMGDFKPKVLFPVYRKDLPSSYIAYYELKLEQSGRQSYAIVSAGKETGDYSLVETGDLPSPLDKLRDQAHSNGHYCAKFFRLSTDGITICEDDRINRIVATTGEISPGSTVTNWEELDDQVLQVLPRSKREWKKLAEESKTIKQWIVSGKPVDRGQPNSRQGEITEKGLHCGDFAEIPVQNVTEIRIKFIGLSRTQSKAKAVNISLRQWQTKLCKVLNNICDSRNPTTVRHDANTLTFAGTKYLKFGVNSNANYVKSELKNQEIRFQVELNMGGGKMIIMRYGIVLGEKRLGRSVQRPNYKIPYENLFPRTHYNEECARPGTMSSAWAMIFSYYDNLGKFRPELGYRRFGFHKDNMSRRFSKVKETQLHISKVISSKVGTKCGSLKQKVQHWDKSKLENWFKEKQGATSRIMFIAGPNKRFKATTRAIHLLKKGIPVVISKENDFTITPKFGVVTRMRQQRFSYRHCDKDDCTVWQELALTEFFVRDRASTGKWQIACTFHAAAALRG